MPDTSATDYHNDIESRFKGILKSFPDDKAVLITIIYLVLSAIGMVFSFFFYNSFDINILDYSQTSDFLIAAFHDPISLVFVALTCLLIWALFKLDKWIRNKFPKYWAISHKWGWFGLSTNANTYIWAYTLILVIYICEAALFYGMYNARNIKKGQGQRIEIVYREALTPTNHKSLPILLGTTGEFIFVYYDQEKQAEVIPTTAVQRMVFKETVKKK
jgi:hypothetical protein